ncbi:MAG TPA: hypothetical protein VFV39_06635 [Limnobacter sp.]|nr:hypothetical protein [Limnobacter sp.]
MNSHFLKWAWLFCMACVGQVHGQSAIQNPLVRPVWVNGNGQGPSQAGGGAAAPQPTQAAGQAAPQVPATDDLREKAAARLTQEDFNIRQQALNAANVPAPLAALFSEMAVSAHVSGAVVLRRPDSVAFSAPAPVVANATNNTSGGSAGQAVNARPVAPAPSAQGGGLGPSVLRLKVGRPVNINGYVLRAKVEDFDVTVEWQNEYGRWVTVFFGAVESASAFNLVPADLEKVDTKAFDYLVPATSSRVLNNGIAGGVGGGNPGFGGGFGNGGLGGFGAQPGQQPGFGSTGSVFR